MQEFKCSESNFTILRQTDNETRIYPYLRDGGGDKVMWQVSPYHGRSFVVAHDREHERYIVSKGNGLSYSPYSFLNTREMGDDTWGLLLKQDAIRDFDLGEDVRQLGIRTNLMEYILEIDKSIMLSSGRCLNPILLQYSVECPYRICDTAYMSKNELEKCVRMWERFNNRGHHTWHMIAAEVLIRNLQTLHSHNILHNAISPQNYTWALELVDFELACSPTHPYTSEDDARHAKDYFDREVVFTYDIINHIATSLGEKVDDYAVIALFEECGFCLSKFSPTQS